MRLNHSQKDPTPWICLIKEAIDRIERQKDGLRNLVKKVISWIVHARRPLSVGELQHALAIIEG